jgi:hypothetical protein
MIDAPGNGNGQDTSEAPATYARRPASVFHGSSRISVLSSKAGRILHLGEPQGWIDGRLSPIGAFLKDQVGKGGVDRICGKSI